MIGEGGRVLPHFHRTRYEEPVLVITRLTLYLEHTKTAHRRLRTFPLSCVYDEGFGSGVLGYLAKRLNFSFSDYLRR